MPAELDDAHYNMLVEHLPYEIDMLRRSFEFLAANGRSDIEAAFPNDPIVAQYLHNAAAETFWIHARALLEFFRRKSQMEGRVACAQDFTKTYIEYDLPFGNLEDEINEQICHLQYKRYREVDKKIGGYSMERVNEALDRAIQMFEENLTEDASELWSQPASARIKVSESFSATNSIQFSSTMSDISMQNSTGTLSGGVWTYKFGPAKQSDDKE